MSGDVDPSVKHLLGVAIKYDGAATVILVVVPHRGPSRTEEHGSGWLW
jgi:hypothetical protein